MIKFFIFIPAFAAWVTIVYAGFSEKKIMFIHNSRDAVIYLGILGMLLCMISIIKFVSTAPANPMSITGYVLGAIALLTFAVQLFNWKLPLLDNPKAALIIISAVMLIKFVIARFSFLLSK